LQCTIVYSNSRMFDWIYVVPPADRNRNAVFPFTPACVARNLHLVHVLPVASINVPKSIALGFCGREQPITVVQCSPICWSLSPVHSTFRAPSFRLSSSSFVIKKIFTIGRLWVPPPSSSANFMLLHLVLLVFSGQLREHSAISPCNHPFQCSRALRTKIVRS